MSYRVSAAALLLAAVLSGCSTFNKSEIGVIRQSGAAPAVVAKMEHGNRLLPEDIIELTHRHVPDSYILRQIYAEGVDYIVTPEDIQRLRKARVNPVVIDDLITASDNFASAMSVAREPRTRVYSGVYEDEYYGSPIHGEVGVGFSTGGRRYYRGHP